jgi:hypothetical protein
MSLLINWLKSFIWSSDDPLPKENQIALIKNSLNETNEKIQKIDEGLKKINEQNQQTAEKNKATFKGLQKINQQLLLLTDSTDFDKFCDFLIKDYKDVGYDCNNMKDIYSITELNNKELKLIYNEMDKFDYSKEHMLYGRYLDFNRIVGEIKRNKKHNGNKRLLAIELIESDNEHLPPINYYKYTFTQNEYDEKMKDTFEYFLYNYCRGENRLSKNEFKLIYDKMDRSNIYWSKLKKSRYNDFESMKKKILYFKKKNGNKELKDIVLIRVTDSYCPKNVYRYVFQ